ncbi:MAG: hypothetical protein WA820_28745 [Bradyrhizobium sp.]
MGGMLNRPQKRNASLGVRGYRSIARTINARIGSLSAATNGRMTCDCPIWSRGLPARLAAGAAPMSGLIDNRLQRMPDMPNEVNRALHSFMQGL